MYLLWTGIEDYNKLGWEADLVIPDVSVKAAQALAASKVSRSTHVELVGSLAYAIWGGIPTISLETNATAFVLRL